MEKGRREAALCRLQLLGDGMQPRRG